MNLQELFDRLNKENWLEKIKNALTENLLIKMIAVIITITLFLIVKTERFDMENLVLKQVPIRKQIVGSPPDGFTAIVTLVPNKVDIYGAQSRVSGVTEVETEVIDLSKIEKTTTKEVAINVRVTKFYSIEPKSVKAYIEIQKIK